MISTRDFERPPSWFLELYGIRPRPANPFLEFSCSSDEGGRGASDFGCIVTMEQGRAVISNPLSKHVERKKALEAPPSSDFVRPVTPKARSSSDLVRKMITKACLSKDFERPVGAKPISRVFSSLRVWGPRATVFSSFLVCARSRAEPIPRVSSTSSACEAGR